MRQQDASGVALIIATAAWMSSAACDFERDTVFPGTYGELQAGRAATAQAAVSGMPMPMSMSAAAPASSTAPAKPAATTMPKPASDSTPAASAPSAADKPATGSCDLTGRWLMTVHKVTDGLGVLQTSHEYHYLEIAKRDDAFEISRSLYCHMDTVGGGAFAIEVKWTAAQPAIMAKLKQIGRKITSVPAATGCNINIEKRYSVMGATLPYYLDPSTTLPSAEEMASADKPGWEDWDGDGNPGLTGVTSGTIVGKIFVAPRDWTEFSGTVPSVSSVFKLALKWDQEANVMSFDGSPFLGSSAVRAADAALHFAELAPLGDDQAQGSDDAAVCASLIPQAPMLTPEAAGM